LLVPDVEELEPELPDELDVPLDVPVDVGFFVVVASLANTMSLAA
jgi:hypothetical protein